MITTPLDTQPKFNSTDIQTLTNLAEPLFVEKNDFLLNTDASYYYIKFGEVLITNSDQRIKLKAGDVIGADAISIKATEPSLLIAITQNELHAASKNLHIKLLTKIVEQLTKREAETKKAFKTFEMFVISLLFVISLYTMSLIPLLEFVHYFGVSTIVDVALLLSFSLLVFIIMKKSAYPLATYGVTFNKWGTYMREATILTLPFLLFFLFLKWVLITFIPTYSHIPLLNPAAAFANIHFTYTTFFVTILIYIGFAFIQEFIARCGLQTAFYRFMPYSKNNQLKAIFLSNVIFAMAHTHMGTVFALAAFIPGLFWGWLYARQNSIIGVSVSHILIGIWVLFVLGYPQFLN